MCKVNIVKLSADNPSKWYKFVGDVQLAINSNYHSSTKKSPSEILFGVKMKTNFCPELRNICLEAFEDDFCEEREEVRRQARMDIEKAQQSYKRNYDRHRKEDLKYDINDIVAIKRTQFTQGRKLANEFLGPYKVTKIKPNGRYDVEKIGESEGRRT